MKETCSFAKEMGKRVAQRRKELGLTQEKAAERCGLSQQFFASIETGGKNVRGESLLKLAMGLDISWTSCSSGCGSCPGRSTATCSR